MRKNIVPCNFSSLERPLELQYKRFLTGSYVEGLVSSWVELFGELVETSVGESRLGEVGHWGHDFEGHLLPNSFLSSLCFLATAR